MNFSVDSSSPVRGWQAVRSIATNAPSWVLVRATSTSSTYSTSSTPAVDGEIVTDHGPSGGLQSTRDIRPAVDGEITTDSGLPDNEQLIKFQLAVDGEVAPDGGVLGDL
ncbi:hypothetical protein [Streptomyces sp. NPDC004533]|uniref:hypothetical protein n=1 Tax=Streptomyces sp. NPDC004533 TaxID=3154278 RepID=UPI0033BBC6D4